jgi:hypothetical protein
MFYLVDLLAHYLVVLRLKQDHDDSGCHLHNEFRGQCKKRLRDNDKNFIADVRRFVQMRTFVRTVFSFE